MEQFYLKKQTNMHSNYIKKYSYIIYIFFFIGHTYFKASSGWLTNWKKRHVVVFRKVCEESPSVVTVVTIQRAKHALKSLRNLVETSSGVENDALSALSNLENRSNKTKLK